MGLRRSGLAAALALTGLALGLARVAAADATPPQLLSFSVSPASIDSSAGTSTLTFSITAQDAANGIGASAAAASGISLSLQSGSNIISKQGLPITGGTSTNPVFQFTIAVPQFTPAGVYAIAVTLTDNASNTVTFNAAALQQLGLPSTITVTESAFGSVTLSASTANIGPAGGSGSVQVIASNRDFAWTATSNASWLTITTGASGTGTATLSYLAAPNNSPTQRNGIITVSGQTFTVIQAPALSSLTLSATTLSFNYQIGGAAPPAQTVTAFSSSAPIRFTASASSSGNWLFVSPANGVTSALVSVFVNADGLAIGTYSGTVALTASGSANGSQTIAVTLTVSGGGASSTPIAASPPALAFSYQSGGAQPTTQTISVSAASATTLSATASSTGGWLAVSPAGASTPAALTVSVSPAALAPGTYSGSVAIVAAGSSQTIPVTLVVTATPTIAISPASLTFSAVVGGTTPPSQTLSLSGGASGLSYTASASSSGNWLLLGAPGGTLPGGLAVSVNTLGLAAGTYSGSIALTPAGGAIQTVPVTLIVSAASQQFAVNPSTLAINYQAGDPNPTPPAISLTGSAASYTAVASSSGNWLAVSPGSGAIPATLSAQVNPSGLAAGGYTGLIQITSGGSTQTVTVTLTVVSAQSLTLSPSSLAFTYQSGGSTPAPQNITVGCPNSALAFRPTASSIGSWLSVTIPSAQNNNQVIVTANPTGLPAGSYQGTVSIFGVGACNTVSNVPVTLTVTAASATPSQGALSLSAGSLSFTPATGTAPPAQQVTVSCSTSSVSYTTAASSAQGWLSVSPLGGTTPGTLSVSADPTGLDAGTYTGSISVASASCGTAPALAVTLTVTSALATPSTLTIAPTALTFSYQSGGANPATQSLSLTGATGAAFSVSTSGNWLSVNPLSGTAPATLTVAVNPAGLLAGTYSGSVSVASQNIPVTLTISGATSSLSPVSTPIAFTYQIGDPTPAAQSLPVSGASGTSFTAAAASPSNWLLVTPLTGTFPATLSVSVNPAGLAAGSYAGLITITLSGNSATAQSVPVTLQINAPSQSSPQTGAIPKLSSLLNAGSLLVGPVAPGEIISIFGQGMGPASGMNLNLTSDGLVANDLGGVQVLFDGAAAPLLYARQDQINLVVPYSVAGKRSVHFTVQYQGGQSAPSEILVADAAPAIFTTEQSGQGQGAILNQDTSVNSGLNPADRGSIVTIFASGAGLLDPAAQDGAVSAGPGSVVLPVSVLVDGENTNLTYAGPAPGLVSGVLQVNFRIPNDATTGKTVGLLLKAGRFTSQPGVSIAIR